MERWLRPSSGLSRAIFNAQGGIIRYAGHVLRIDTTETVMLEKPTILLAASFNTSDQRDAFRLLGWSQADTVDVEALARVVSTCPAP